jgi:hypothetical protein
MAQKFITLENMFILFLITSLMYFFINSFISFKNNRNFQNKLAEETIKELSKGKKKGRITIPEVDEIQPVRFKSLMRVSYSTYFIAVFIILLIIGGN